MKRRKTTARHRRAAQSLPTAPLLPDAAGRDDKTVPPGVPQPR